MNAAATKLAMRGLLILGLIVIVSVAASMRSDTQGITYATADGFNLKIDSKASYNGVSVPASTWNLKNLTPGSDKFFNISDVKPGDHGEATISMHVNKNSWVCLDFEKLKQYENGRNEPEKLVDPTGGVNDGELASGTEFFAWFDDGDNIFEVGELPIFGTTTQAAVQVLNNKTYVLADSLAGYPLVASTTKYIAITWCAGNLTVSTSTAVIGCDGTALGNAAQTDSFTVDIGIRAVPTKGNKNFRCEKSENSCQRPSPVKVIINNEGEVISSTNSNSNTGGNSAGGSEGGSGSAGGSPSTGSGQGGTVNTGTARSTSTTENILNRTIIRTR